MSKHKWSILGVAMLVVAMGMPVNKAHAADPVPLPRSEDVALQTHTGAPPQAPAQAREAAARTICINAHVENIGWQGWSCGSDGLVASVGTTGQSLRMEALAVVTAGTGGICANAHVQNIGWQGWACGADGQVVVVGTTGQSLRMEGLWIGAPQANLCANAHVQNIGWQGWNCQPAGFAAAVGTTGQSLRMEALLALVY